MIHLAVSRKRRVDLRAQRKRRDEIRAEASVCCPYSKMGFGVTLDLADCQFTTIDPLTFQRTGP